jgi:hypothetical protein
MFTRCIFWRRRREANDFAEEIRSHLELEAVERETEGMTKKVAERVARVGFGRRSLRRGETNCWKKFSDA